MQQGQSASPDVPSALVALGGNIASRAGPPEATLAAAARAIAKAIGQPGSEAVVSRLYRTPAFPPGRGPDYCNGTMTLRTQLSAAEILSGLHRIEAAFDRDRRVRWGERTLDLDLLAVGQAVVPNSAEFRRWMDLPLRQQALVAPSQLVLPHPRMHERGFVLVPLADIAPDWRHPILNLSVSELCAALPAAALDGIAPVTGSRPRRLSIPSAGFK